MVSQKAKKIAATTLVLSAGFGAIACGRSPTGSANANSTTAESLEKRGEQIVAEYLKRDAAPFRKMRVRFTIDPEDEPQEVYEVENWRKQSPDGTTTMSRIVKPAEDADLCSLTLEPKGQKATVVTYAGSRDEFRETDTSKMFFGGLTGGELLGEWHKYNFRLVGEKEIGGQKLLELEGKLKPNESSVAAKLNILFRADDHMPAELHTFDNAGREIRTWRITDVKTDANGAYAARTEIDNPVYKAKIVIDIVNREFPATIDDAVFTRDRLKQISAK